MSVYEAMEEERRRRLVGAWREGRPSERVVMAARRRFVRARTVATLSLAGLLVSFSYGTAAALALCGGGYVVSKWSQQRRLADAVRASPDVHPLDRPAAYPPAVPSVIAPTDVPPTVADEQHATDSARSTPPEISHARSAAVVRAHPPAPVYDPPRASAPTQVGAEAMAPESPAGAEASAWERVASALGRHDAPAADVALAELSTRSDPRTRDAAQLARAELWISQGQSERAHPLLETLAKTGSTGIIRKRAQDLLATFRR